MGSILRSVWWTKMARHQATIVVVVLVTYFATLQIADKYSAYAAGAIAVLVIGGLGRVPVLDAMVALASILTAEVVSFGISNTSYGPIFWTVAGVFLTCVAALIIVIAKSEAKQQGMSKKITVLAYMPEYILILIPVLITSLQ